MIIFLPIGQWMVLCFVSVTIKLALGFAKLPIPISAMMRGKSKAGEWGDSCWWEFMFSAQRPGRPEGPRVSFLHSPPQTIQLELSVKILFKRKLRKEPVKVWILSLEHLKASWSHHTMASLIVDLLWVLILYCVIPLLLAQESLASVLESIRRHTGSWMLPLVTGREADDF